MRNCMLALCLFAGTLAHGEVKTQLSCFDPIAFGGLEWNFSVTSLPQDGKPGAIRGTISQLLVPTPQGPGLPVSNQDYEPSVQTTSDATFWYEEGYAEITVVPTDLGDNVTKVKIRLENPLADNLGYEGQEMKGKKVFGEAKVTLEFATDAPVQSPSMNCTMVNL